MLDSTDPTAVLDTELSLDPAKTLYIVSTKSGGTVETTSFLKYFYNRTMAKLGEKEAGAHFVAITDPGSEIANTAERYQFRAIFLNDPNIGGRYSALSLFGLVPAGLVGVDLKKLLRRAAGMAHACELAETASNPGARLGTMIGELALQGRDKLTLISSADICTFGDWLEQLIAESTGKEGGGFCRWLGKCQGTPISTGRIGHLYTSG